MLEVVVAGRGCPSASTYPENMKAVCWYLCGRGFDRCPRRGLSTGAYVYHAQRMTRRARPKGLRHAAALGERPETAGTDVHLARLSLLLDRRALNIGSKHPVRPPLGVAHVVAKAGALAADVTFSGQLGPPYQCSHGFDGGPTRRIRLQFLHCQRCGPTSRKDSMALTLRQGHGHQRAACPLYAYDQAADRFA